MNSMLWKRFLLVGTTVMFIASCRTEQSYECSADFSDVDINGSFLSEQREDIEVSKLSTRPLGLACHNCYENTSEEAVDTLALIHHAIDKGLDLVELDVVIKDGLWIVSHEAKSDGPRLVDILTDKTFLESEQLLFVEIKGSEYSDAQLADLLNIFASFTNAYEETAYVRTDRMLILRNSGSNQMLVQIRMLLETSDFSHIKHSVKLSRLYHKFQVAQDPRGVYQSKRCGLHMLEFDVLSQGEFVIPLAKKAREEGMLVNFFTVTENSLVNSERLFDLADVLTLDKEVIESEASLTEVKLKVFR